MYTSKSVLKRIGLSLLAMISLSSVSFMQSEPDQRDLIILTNGTQIAAGIFLLYDSYKSYEKVWTTFLDTLKTKGISGDYYTTIKFVCVTAGGIALLQLGWKYLKENINKDKCRKR